MGSLEFGVLSMPFGLINMDNMQNVIFKTFTLRHENEKVPFANFFMSFTFAENCIFRYLGT